MLKLTKYFLIFFLISTFIPLLLMFIFDNIHIEQLKEGKNRQIIKLASKEVDKRAEQLLYTTEQHILRVLDIVKPNDSNLSSIKNLVEARSISWIKKSDVFLKANRISKRTITSYYKVYPDEKSRLKLCAVYIVPEERDDRFGLMIVKDVDLTSFHPSGPFILRFYNDNSSQGKLIAVVDDAFEKFHRLTKESKKGIIIDFLNSGDKRNRKSDTSPYYKFNQSIFLKGCNGTYAAFIIINMHMPPPPPDKIPTLNIPLFPGVVILFGGLLISLIFGFMINSYFIYPLSIFSELTKKVKNGDLNIDPSISFWQEEINQTFENFKSMVLGLKEKEEIKNIFIESLTHDLKTPIIAQQRALELIAKEFKEAMMWDQFQLAKGLEKNNKHLLHMINKILEASKFDFEEIDIEPGKIDLHLLIEDCFQNVLSITEDDNITLINNIKEDSDYILGDSTTLKRVFLNLLSNSIDNLGNHGVVTVSTLSTESKIIVVFEDNGTGISQNEIPYIFNRYYSGKSDERKLGCGLGLYVCKQLVELNQGEISVETKVNEYTRFLITLHKFK